MLRSPAVTVAGDRTDEEIKNEKIRRAIFAGPSSVTAEATVAEMDPRGNLTVLRAGTNDWVCMPGHQNVVGWPDTRIRHIPAVIVQGRYDAVCPMESAWALHRAWPAAEFIITPDSGHSAFDPPNSRALVASTDKFAG